MNAEQDANPVRAPESYLQSLWLLPTVAILLVGTVLGWFAYADYQRTIEAESRHLESLARITEGQVSGRLLNLKTVLAGIADDYQNRPATRAEDFNERLEKQRKEFPVMRSLVVVGANGRVIHSATPALLGFDSSQRDYFRAHADFPDRPAFYLSQPFRAASGGIAIAASHALRDRNDRLLAVIVAGLDPAYFQNVLADARPSEEDGMAALVNTRSIIVGRVPDAEKFVGKDISGNRVLKQLLDSRARSVTGRTVAVTDGVERLYSMYRVGDVELVAIVGRSMKHILTEWRQTLVLRAAIFVFAATVLLGLTLVASRQRRQRMLAEARTEQDAHFIAETVASLPGVFYLLSDTGHFVRWNHLFETLTGYSADEMRSKHALEVIAEHDREMISERIAEVFATGQSYAEASLLTRDGHAIPHYFTGRRVELGGKPYLIGIGIDVSERKALEARALELADLNGKILQASPIGISAYRASDGQCVIANEAAGRLVGATPQVLVNQRFRELRSWQETGLLDAAERALGCDEVVIHETRTTTSFGKGVWLDVRLSRAMLFGEPHLLVVYEEVADRRWIEEAQALALLDASPEAMLVVESGVGGKIVYANSSAESVFCQGGKGLVGRPVDDLLPDRLRKQHGTKRLGFTHQGAYPELKAGRQLSARRLNGEEFPAEISLSRVRLAGQDVIIAAVVDVSDRLAAEEELRTSEQRWQFALEGAGDGVWDWNFESGELTYSKRSQELLGLTGGARERTIAKLQAVADPDDMKAAMIRLEDYLDGRADTFEAEYRIHRGEPGERWILTRGMVISRAEDGRPRRMIGTHSDITERKRQAETIRQSEEQLRLLLDSTAEAIFGVDLDGRCIFCNRSALGMLGVDSAGKLLGTNMFTLLQLPTAEQPGSPWRFREGEQVHLEDVLLPDGKGESFHAECWVFPRRKGDEIVGAVVTFLDISERVEAEARLKTLSSAVEYSPTAIVITDPQGSIEYTNAAFSETTGYRPEEVIGRNPNILNSGCQSQAFFAELWQTISAGNVWKGEILNRKKSGEIYLDRVIITPIIVDDSIAHYVALKEDITAQRQAEEDLRQAKRAADAANQAKSDFLANMSHEIRTPMNAIVGLSHLCMETSLTPKQHDYLRKINASAKSLHHILNEILDFSKVEAGRLELEDIPFSVPSILDHLLSVLSARADEKSIALRVEIGPGMPTTLLGDPLRLTQVLINLGGNAVKFTEHGEVVVSVVCEHQDDEFADLTFSVRDTGIGIRQDQLEHLFSPFTQADTSITRRFGGTGLGLAISKRLVDLMGGSLLAESTVGAGSIFRIQLRLRRGSVAAMRLQQSVSVDEAIRRVCGAHLLLAEDNELNQQVAAELLSMAGITIEIAGNGREAVDLVLGKPFDGVLMDVSMPVLDGIGAARELRTHPQLAALPIIAVTAAVADSDRQRCKEAGMNDFIAKPLDLGAMLPVLARWIVPANPIDPEALGLIHDNAGNDVPLPILPGVDVANAVQRMGGMASTYVSVLQRMRTNQEGAVEQIRSALRDNDRARAERLAHTLKGIAGTIGALRLAAPAEGLLDAIRRGDVALTEAMLEQTGSELQQLMNAIDASPMVVPSSPAASPADSVLDLVAIESCLQQARQQLLCFDAEIEGTLAALAELVRANPDLLASLVEVQNLITAYNYMDGLTALDRWAGRIGGLHRGDEA